MPQGVASGILYVVSFGVSLVKNSSRYSLWDLFKRVIWDVSHWGFLLLRFPQNALSGIPAEVFFYDSSRNSVTGSTLSSFWNSSRFFFGVWTRSFFWNLFWDSLRNSCWNSSKIFQEFLLGFLPEFFQWFFNFVDSVIHPGVFMGSSRSLLWFVIFLQEFFLGSIQEFLLIFHLPPQIPPFEIHPEVPSGFPSGIPSLLGLIQEFLQGFQLSILLRFHQGFLLIPFRNSKTRHF